MHMEGRKEARGIFKVSHAVDYRDAPHRKKIHKKLFSCHLLSLKSLKASAAAAAMKRNICGKVD